MYERCAQRFNYTSFVIQCCISKRPYSLLMMVFSIIVLITYDSSKYTDAKKEVCT